MAAVNAKKKFRNRHLLSPLKFFSCLQAPANPFEFPVCFPVDLPIRPQPAQQQVQPLARSRRKEKTRLTRLDLIIQAAFAQIGLARRLTAGPRPVDIVCRRGPAFRNSRHISLADDLQASGSGWAVAVAWPRPAQRANCSECRRCH